jgi:copper chaperone NosL
MKKMRTGSRIIIAVASLGLTATYFLPVWFIFLIAPQYPEGLTMNIWLNKITGEVDIINGLNHYIGMKHISAEMFPEFGYLIYVVGFFILFGLLVAITGKRKLLLAYLFLTVAGGVAAIVDFYTWGYNYGHNLDPKAPIQVPGLYYQPPVIGHKTLLNFDAYSYPDVGGWIVIAMAGLFFGVYIYEWLRVRKATKFHRGFGRKVAPAAAAVLMIFFSSCQAKTEPIAYGKDVCDDCRMTAMDPRFGAEILTNKGKLYKFDDARCIAHFIKTGRVNQADIKQVVFVDFNNSKNLVDADKAVFAVSPELQSPMNSNAAAFTSRQMADNILASKGGKIKTWDELLNNK